MAAGQPIFSIRRLRWAMLVGGLAVMVVVTGYIGYARYRLHKYVSGLPGRLGINIEQETDHVTYSQTWQGRTVFTLRAAKQIQHKDGKITLKDVGIVLYGRQGDRADRIHGNEFEYDQKGGIMTAVGEVFIDLAPPPSGKDGAPGKTAPGSNDESRMIHLKTSGLVFRQKEQFATTDQALEFMVAGMTGTALGGSYDSQKGVVVMQSQVHVSGLRGRTGGARGDERPMVLTAGHAELDRVGNVAILEGARLVSATDNGSQTASAQHAVVHMEADGTPRRVDANGDVTLTGEGRGTVTADRMALDLNAAGQPSAAHLMGVVRFANDADKKQQHGRANDARIAFDPQGRPVHALMTGEVEADLNADMGASRRWLSGDTVELALAGGGKDPVVVRGATATAAAGARLRLVDASAHKDAKGKVTNGVLTTNVKADLLTARFDAKSAKTQVTGVDGAGRTVVERTLVNVGSTTPEWKETGTGDALKVDFREDAKGRAEMTRAEQRGSVKIVREAVPAAAAAKKGAGPEVEHAEGNVAVYETDADRMTMTGGVKVSDAESALFADRVEMFRATGEGVAEGSVRVSYLQQGSTGEPVHVIAARAVGHKTTGVTQFFAAPGGYARMWQGGSTVEAPVLDFDRTKKTLLAHGASGSNGLLVKTVLVEEKNAKSGPPPAAKDDKFSLDKKKDSGGPVRVLSRELFYADATRQAEFRGQVQVNDQDGMMTSQQATVYLAPKGAGAATDAAMSLGGKVDHMVATGAVQLEQPGRKGWGEKLVYTASDRIFVLTGTKALPPKVVDETQGTVTGASLRFRSGDDSVEVLSGDGAPKVHTETHMKQKD